MPRIKLKTSCTQGEHPTHRAIVPASSSLPFFIQSMISLSYPGKTWTHSLPPLAFCIAEIIGLWHPALTQTRIPKEILLAGDNFPMKIFATKHNGHHHRLSLIIFPEPSSEWCIILSNYLRGITCNNQVEVHGLRFQRRAGNTAVDSAVRFLDFGDGQLERFPCLLDLVTAFL